MDHGGWPDSIGDFTDAIDWDFALEPNEELEENGTKEKTTTNS